MIFIVIGALFSLIVGIASTVADTHETVELGNPPKPTQRITRAGQLAIAFLFLGALVTCYAGYAQYRDASKDEEKAEETFRTANEIDSKANIILQMDEGINKQAKQLLQTDEDVKEQNQKVEIAEWRMEHSVKDDGFNGIFYINVSGTKTPAFMEHWLSRVTSDYDRFESSNHDTAFDGSDEVVGNKVVTIAPNTPAWTLSPMGQDEEFVDQTLFHPEILLSVSRGKTMPIIDILDFKTTCSYVNIYYDSKTRLPVSVQAEIHGTAPFLKSNGIRGWLDLYGETLIFRFYLHHGDYYLQPIIKFAQSLNLLVISVGSIDDAWGSIVVQPGLTVNDVQLVRDEEGSFILHNADWHTLGTVPSDFPGPRFSDYGPIEASP